MVILENVFLFLEKMEGEAACFLALTSLRSARVVVPFTAPGGPTWGGIRAWIRISCKSIASSWENS